MSMRKLLGVVGCILVLTLLVSGCGKSEQNKSQRISQQSVVSHAETAEPVPSDALTAPETVGTNAQEDITPDEISSHRVLYQEGIDVTIEKDGTPVTERIAVYGVAGARFPAGRIEVDRRAKLSRTVISIEDAKGGFLIPEKDSAVPINMGFDQRQKFGMSFFTHAINVTWTFAKPGIRFIAGDSIYESEKAGASVSFTEEGTMIDGLKKSSAGKQRRK